MKNKQLLILAILLAAITLLGCKENKDGSPEEWEKMNADESYALGMDIGANFQRNRMYPNIGQLVKGLKARASGGKTRFDDEKAYSLLDETFSSIQQMRQTNFDELPEDGSPADWEKLSKDASYALGVNIGSDFAYNRIFPILSEFKNGLKDRTSGKPTRFDEEEAFNMLNTFFLNLRQERDAQFINKQIEFLEENGQRPEVITTESGLQYEIITETDGEKPDSTSLVSVHYEGSFVDGTIFDSSIQRGIPAEFYVDGVIPGWTEGLQLMSVGSKYKFVIPSDIGYGTMGTPYGPIPPNAALIFEVELLEIINREEE